jgi:TolB protein
MRTRISIIIVRGFAIGALALIAGCTFVLFDKIQPSITEGTSVSTISMVIKETPTLYANTTIEVNQTSITAYPTNTASSMPIPTGHDPCENIAVDELSSMTLIFSANWDGDYEIYTIQADGNNLKKLTDNEKDDVAPLWSPDGEKIAFVTRSLGNLGQLIVMKSNGTDLIPITTDDFAIAPLEWSPDNRYIAFEGEQDGMADFYIVDPSTSAPMKVSDSEDYFFPSNLTWSPHSNELAYDVGLALTGSLRGVILVKLDNPSIYKLLHQSGENPAEWFSDSLPDWDLQHNWIALVSSSIPINEEQVYIIRPNGSNRQQLTTSNSRKILVRWSPNGEMIAYGAVIGPIENNTSEKAIYVINPDGSNERMVLIGRGVQGDKFSWSPNNFYLAYILSSLEKPDIYDLYYVNICNKETVLITKNVSNFMPNWKP